MTMKRPRLLTALAALLGAATATPEALAAADTALDEVLPGAADAFPDLTEDEKMAACDAAMRTLAKDSLTEDEKADAFKAAQDAKVAARATRAAAAPTPALDVAAVQAAVDAAVATATKDLITADAAAALASDAVAAVHALYAARELVADKVGPVALDSAESVHRFALDKLGVPHKDVPAAALAALFTASVTATAAALDARPPVAGVPSITALFPHLSTIRRS